MDGVTLFIVLAGLLLYFIWMHPIIFSFIVIGLIFLFVYRIFATCINGNTGRTSVSQSKTHKQTHFFEDEAKTHTKKHKGRCNGDCANCPPHYGYRYGRWYYGHDHIEGCEFGGNRGGGGM